MNDSSSVLRFGVFELDRRSGELRRSGRRLHLAPQATQLLTLLADRAGMLVTREEIRQALWPDGTFVEFDAAVNACVSQIRTALGDKASSPRFVETLPRRGYRFVAPVEEVTSDVPTAEAQAGQPGIRRRTVIAAASIAAAIGLALFAAAGPHRRGAADYVTRHGVEALQKYERARGGLEDASPTELADRVGFFTTAIRLSPEFAEAYAGIADAKLILAAYRAEHPPLAYAAAKGAAAKALALDPDLGDAHAAYATAVLLLDWDWAGARTHFARALAATPVSPRVHHWYARYLTALGRHRDALAHAQRAAAAAPASPSAATYLGVAEFYSGDLAAARRHCQRALGLMPEFTPAQRCLDALDAPTATAAAMPDMYLQPALRAAYDGNIAEALDRLQRAANRHTDALVYASVLPGLKPLHGEPRFGMVLQRVGLRGADPAR